MANISAGPGRLGYDPVLVGAVGDDLAEYRSWLTDQGVDTESGLVGPEEHIARFLCAGDENQKPDCVVLPRGHASGRPDRVCADHRPDW